MVNLSFPGDPMLGQVLRLVLTVIFELGLYAAVLLALTRYIKPVTPGNRAIGLLVGGGIGGILAARGYALAYEKIFQAGATETGIVLVVGIVANLALADFIVRACNPEH